MQPRNCTAARGYYCSAGSINASGIACPPHYICPGGSSWPCPGVCGPIAWFDAMALLGLYPDGAPVTLWPDMSGGAYGSVGSVLDVEAATNASSAPVFHASAMAGGGPGVVFNGAGDVLSSLNVVTTGAALTFFAVIIDAGGAAACCSIVLRTTNPTGSAGSAYNGITLSGGGGAPAGGAVALSVEYGASRNAGTYNLTGGLQRVLAVVYNASGGTVGPSSFVDGCANTSPSALAGAVQASTGLRIGGAASGALGAGQFFKGAIAEFLIFPGALTDTPRRAVESYLGAKWPSPARLACVGGSNSGGGGCPGGTFRDAAGNCDWCSGPPGRYCPVNGTQTWRGVVCPPGLACAGAAAPSVPCAPGRFANTSGLAVCALCVAGTYAAGVGSLGCAPCAGGTFTHVAGAAVCAVCTYGGSALIGAVACDAPPTLAVRGGGACLVQGTGDIACWGSARWAAPFVLWRGGDERARGGRSFVVNASGVCMGDAFVSVLLGSGSVLVVGGDLLHNASAAALLARPQTRLEQLWCGPATVCGRDASTGALICASVAAAAPAAAAAGGPLVLNPVTPPALGPVLSVALGDAHACTLAPNGSASCGAWGPSGNAGGGTTTVLHSPTDAMLRIAAGTSGAWTCGVRARDRAGVCWSSSIGAPLPTPLKSVCLGGGGLACGLVWGPPGALNDASYTGNEHEVCWNASTGALLPGALLPGGPPLRTTGCSDAGRCGVLGNSSALCDRSTLRPACNGSYSSITGLAPGGCFGVAAVAVDAGHAPGIGPGDLVEVTLSRSSGACGDGANVSDGGTFYSPLARAGGSRACPAGVNCMANASLYGGGVVWDAALPALRYTVGTDPGPSLKLSDNTTFYYGIDATRIGVLAFGVSAPYEVCAGPLPGARAALVGGSWGQQPAPGVLSARAYDTGKKPGLSRGDTLLITFDRETNTPPGLAPADILSGVLGAVVTAAWTGKSSLLITVVDPGAAGLTTGVQIGVLRLTVAPPHAVVVSRDLTSPPANVSSMLVDGTWGNSIVSVTSPSLGSLTTAGGDPLVVKLSATIGVNAVASDVNLVYGNGRWNFTAVGCTLAPGGDGLSCFSAEGVGAELAFTVLAYGAVVAIGGSTASYATPAVTGVSPAVIPTSYSGLVTLTGRQFGSVADNAVGGVTFANIGAAAGEVFAGCHCTVNVSHTSIVCELPSVRGASLAIALQVGGQGTASPSLATAPPVLHAVSAVGNASCGGGTMTLCTRGSRGHVLLHGDNLGPAGGTGLAVVASPDAAGATLFALLGCVVATPHVLITCNTLPPGYGGALWFRVSVLGMASALLAPAVPPVGYAPPVIVAIVGAPVPAVGAQLSVLGTGFALGFAPALVRIIIIIIDGGAVSLPPVVARVYGANASLDELVFHMPPGVGGGHRLVVTVGSPARPSTPVAVGYQPPVVASVALSAVNSSGSSGGGATYRMLIIGKNFGTAAANVSVFVNGTRCAVESPLTDAAFECWTAAASGYVNVSVAHQSAAAATAAPYFDAAQPVPVPLIGTLLGAAYPLLPSLPLTGGGGLVVTGSSIVPVAPSIVCMLGVNSTPPSGSVLCARARALSLTPLCSDWCTALSVLHGSSLLCTTPAARAASASLVVVALALLSCASSPPATMYYDPPAVLAATPRRLPTAGGTVLVINGANFEGNTSIGVESDSAPPSSESTSCALLNGSTVQIVCVSPPGAGASAHLTLVSPTWPAVASFALPGFGYRAPVIDSVHPALADAGGDTIVTITGSDFSAAPAVYLDGAVLPPGAVVWQLAHNALGVRVPAGVGAGINVTIAAGGQIGSLPHTLSYYPPTVTSVNVSYINAVSGAALRILGSQFGPPGGPPPSPQVSVQGLECSAARVLSDGAIECVAPPALVVAAGVLVTVSVGQQMSKEARVRVACPPGYYGLSGERCSACPSGAVCAGLDVDPVPSAGFFRSGRATFTPCIPAVACVALLPNAVSTALAGGAETGVAYANCAAGYSGDLCRVCADRWYRKANVQVRNGARCSGRWQLVLRFPCGACSVAFVWATGLV